MRKVMLLAAVMAMVLAAAAPAFAQATAVGGDVQYVDCDQIQAAATGQYNVDNNQDLAGIAQELGVSQNQVSACLGSIAAGGDVNIDASASASASATTYAKKYYSTASATSYAKHGGSYSSGGSSGGGGSASAAAGGSLPDTGGASLIALGAGALLVAGGLLARRIVR